MRLRRCFRSIDTAPVRSRLSRILQPGGSCRITHGGTLEARIDAAVDGHQFKPDIDVLVLDGIPRNVGQAEIMDQLIDVKKVFHLSCPTREALFTRLKKRALKDNRLDDANEEVIKRRLATYESESKPVLEHYKDRVQVVDATEPPARVLFHILETVSNGEHESVTI
jgi:adenylate kinase